MAVARPVNGFTNPAPQSLKGDRSTFKRGRASDLVTPETRWIRRELYPDRLANCLRQPKLVHKATTTAGLLDSLWDVGFGVNRETVQAPYRESPWVHACIKAKGSAVRSTPLRFYLTDPDTDQDAEPLGDNDPLVRLFSDPNPAMSSGEFFEAGAHHRFLTGEDFWVLFDAAGNILEPREAGDTFELPASIQPITGAAVEHSLDALGNVRVWRFNPSHALKPIDLMPNQVIHFRDYDQHNPNRGLGDVQVLVRVLQQEFTAERYMEAILEHSGDPGGFITTRRDLTPESKRVLEAERDDEFGVESAGQYKIITGDDVKVLPTSRSPKDLEFGNLFTRVRDLVCSVTGVPAPVVGVLDRATWNNYNQARRAMWTGANGVVSYQTTVEDTINHKFLPRLRDRKYAGVIARFDYRNVADLELDNTDKIAAARDLVKSVPGMTWPRAGRICGLDPVEIKEAKDPLDTALVNKGLIPFLAATGEQELPEHAKPQPPMLMPPREPGGTDDDTGAPVGMDADEAKAARLARRDAESKKLEDRAARLEYWRAFEQDVLVGVEASMESHVRAYVRRYHVAQRLKVHAFADSGEAPAQAAAAILKTRGVSLADINFLLLEREKWDELFASIITPDIELAWQLGGQGMAAELGTAFIGMTNPTVIQEIQLQVIQLVEGANSTLADQVRRSMLKVLSSGEASTTAELQQLIRQNLVAFDDEFGLLFGADRIDSRAQTIARTESAHAANTARFEQVRHDRVEEHQWIDSGDAAVRDAHEALDGVIVKVGEEFGGHAGLTHPNASGAAAELVINCRCVARPILKEDS